MMPFSRLSYETKQTEMKLNPLYTSLHQAIQSAENPGRRISESPRFRWLSAAILLNHQAEHPDRLPEVLPEPAIISRELQGEVRAILSDYGTLCLEGMRLLFAFLALWLLLQEIVLLRFNLGLFSGLVIGCLILYPTAVYAYWNWGALHPFKAMKLALTAAGATAAAAGIYLLGVLENQHPFFESILLSSFNFTEFLIAVNLAVFLSFVIHYRRLNLFHEVRTHYREHFVSLSGLGLQEQKEIDHLLTALDPIPLKTHTKRRLKSLAIAKYCHVDSDRADTAWVRRFIRTHCIDMNWIYWSGSVVQWALVILLLSKLVWARDTGLMVSADYFRQALTTGMILGALALSAGVFYPLNRCFRELLYQGSAFTLRQTWLLAGLMVMGVSLVLLSGLVPSRFLWGDPVNPAPHPLSLLVQLGLILLIQFFKGDPRLSAMDQSEK